MPLYTDAKALCWLLDSLDYAIGSESVDSARWTYFCYSLMVSLDSIEKLSATHSGHVGPVLPVGGAQRELIAIHRGSDFR